MHTHCIDNITKLFRLVGQNVLKPRLNLGIYLFKGAFFVIEDR